MKFLIFLIFIISFVLNTYSQEKGDFRMGMYAQVNSLQDRETPMFGITCEYFLSSKLSMNYKYGIGLNNQGTITAHINPSILSIFFIQSGDALIFSFMIPEGLSYHIYPKEKLEVAPYINPLGSEINMYESPAIALSCNFGMNIHIKPSKDLSITPNLGAMIVYGNYEVVPNVGLSINYNFH